MFCDLISHTSTSESHWYSFLLSLYQAGDTRKAEAPQSRPKCRPLPSSTRVQLLGSSDRTNFAADLQSPAIVSASVLFPPHAAQSPGYYDISQCFCKPQKCRWETFVSNVAHHVWYKYQPPASTGGGASLKVNQAAKWSTATRVTPQDFFKDTCGHFQLFHVDQNQLFLTASRTISIHERADQ